MKPFLLLTLLTLCASCATNKPITSNVNHKEVKSIGILPHYINLQILSSRNQEKVNPEPFVEELNLYIDEAKNTFLTNRKIIPEKTFLSPQETVFVEKEIAEYYKQLCDDEFYNTHFNSDSRSVAFYNVKVSDRVKQILKDNNLRFALATVTIGFSRTTRSENNRVIGNVGKVAAGVGLSLLTGFFVFPRSVPNASATYFFIIDAERGKLTMYNKKVSEIDPINKSSIQGQIILGLEDYFILSSK